jgi:hypothetical protein
MVDNIETMAGRPDPATGTTAFVAVRPCRATFSYTNWKGETAIRTAVLHSVRFGSTEWHPEPQWLVMAFDTDKEGFREFAMKDMREVAYGD